MGESLREVIARIKAQNSQPSKPVEKPAEKPTPASLGEEEEYDEDEMVDDEVKPIVKPSKSVPEASKPDTAEKPEMSAEEQMLVEIEMLQNNGRFRAELLHQLQEINNALVVVAGVLADLSGVKNGK